MCKKGKHYMKMQKGFISLGSEGNTINIDCVDKEKTYYDTRINKVALIDKFGNRFNIDPKLVVNKMKVRNYND
jgi:hypothetical protein